jgi:hypothetical protein
MSAPAQYCAGRRVLAGVLALGLAGPARAAEPAAEPDVRARLEAIYEAANGDVQAGNFAAAAGRYAEAVALLPESQQTHESRALALLDSVGARRQAFARGGDPAQLCAARDLLRAYLVQARATYGPAAAELDGPRQAGRVHGEIEGDLAGMPASTCPGDQPPPAPAAAAPAPAPPRLPPPRRDPRQVAGVALLGVAGAGASLLAIGLGVGAGAEARGRGLHADDPARDVDDLLADGFVQRGEAANRLAVAGGVIAGAALISGAALLIVARLRPRRASALALGPGGLRLRF